MFQKGYKPWNFGKSKTKITFTCECCGKIETKFACGRDIIRFCSNKCAHNKMGTWNKNKKLSEEHKSKISNSMKGKIQTKEHIKKRLCRRDKSSLEIKFENIIQSLKLPYKFVGNGEFFISNKCPDFIDIDNNIAIEVFYRDHKNKFNGGLEKWKSDREELFNENNWQLLFFDETQVNIEKIRSTFNVHGGN